MTAQSLPAGSQDGDSIIRIRREIVDQMFTGPPTPGPRRPVAHVLTILGLTNGGPTYIFECREPANDFGKQCAVSIICDCIPESTIDNRNCPSSPTGFHKRHDGFAWRPTPGCRFQSEVDAEDFDDAVRRLVAKRSLTRGVYFVQVRTDPRTDETVKVELLAELLAEMRSMTGWLSTEPVTLSAMPTTATRYPGYGPEVDLRELIEDSLTDTPGALEWDDEELMVIVDASDAASRILLWLAGQPRPVATIRPSGGVL